MPVCVPISELRNTNKFAELVKKSKQPITVTKNGYAEFVVIDAKKYNACSTDKAENELRDIIKRMEADRKSHNYTDAFKHVKSLEEKYGL